MQRSWISLIIFSTSPLLGMVKVTCTLVQALRLCKGRTAHRGSRGIALPFHGHGTRRGWGVSVTPRPLFTPGKDPVPIVQEAGWAPEPVWTGAKNLALTGIRSPSCAARTQSLYRISYPVHYWGMGIVTFIGIRWVGVPPPCLPREVNISKLVF